MPGNNKKNKQEYKRATADCKLVKSGSDVRCASCVVCVSRKKEGNAKLKTSRRRVLQLFQDSTQSAPGDTPSTKKATQNNSADLRLDEEHTRYSREAYVRVDVLPYLVAPDGR